MKHGEKKNSKYIYLIQQTNKYLHSRCLLEFSSKAIAIRKVIAWKGSVVVESTWNLFVLLSTSGKRLLKNILIRNWKWLWSITILHETQLSLYCHLMCVKYPPLQPLLPAHTLFPGLSLENTFQSNVKKTRRKMSLSCVRAGLGKRTQKHFWCWGRRKKARI